MKSFKTGCLIVLGVLAALIVAVFVMIGRHDVRGSKEECERIQRDNLKRAAEGRLRDTDVAYYDVKCR